MRDPVQYSYDNYRRPAEYSYSKKKHVISKDTYNLPPPPGSAGRNSIPKSCYYEDSSSSSWGFSDPEMKRKKRIVSYKVYSAEGKMKASVRGGLRWVKNKCSLLVRGY